MNICWYTNSFPLVENSNTFDDCMRGRVVTTEVPKLFAPWKIAQNIIIISGVATERHVYCIYYFKLFRLHGKITHWPYFIYYCTRMLFKNQNIFLFSILRNPQFFDEKPKGFRRKYFRNPCHRVYFDST